MHDRLVELLMSVPKLNITCGGRMLGRTYQTAQNIADYLLANGVIVPPWKVVDVVYRVCKQKYPVDSYRMHWEEDWVILTRPFDLSMIPEIGKTVFLTRKEAEQALKGENHAEIH